MSIFDDDGAMYIGYWIMDNEYTWRERRKEEPIGACVSVQWVVETDS